MNSKYLISNRHDSADVSTSQNVIGNSFDKDINTQRKHLILSLDVKTERKV